MSEVTTSKRKPPVAKPPAVTGSPTEKRKKVASSSWLYPISLIVLIGQLVSVILTPLLLVWLLLRVPPADPTPALRELQTKMGGTADPMPALRELKTTIEGLPDHTKAIGTLDTKVAKVDSLSATTTAMQTDLSAIKTQSSESEKKVIKELAELNDQLGKAKKEINWMRGLVLGLDRKAVPQRVLLVALHSKQVDYNLVYKRACWEFFHYLPVYQGHQVGLLVVITRQKDEVVPLNSLPGDVQFDQLSVPRKSDDATEEIDADLAKEITKKLADLPNAPKGPTSRKRVVLLASTQCPLPTAGNLKAWKELPARVDVLLIGPNDPKAKETIEGWRGLCAERNGVCQVLRRTEPGSSVLRPTLIECLQEVASPIPLIPIPIPEK